MNQLETALKEARERIGFVLFSVFTPRNSDATNDLLGEVEEIYKQAYLQGIRDAKGEVPEGRLPKLYFEPDYVDDHDECLAVNKFRKETLEAITRLEENVS